MEKITSGPAYQAFWLLRIVFIVAPIVAGLDKFFQILVEWDQYLSFDPAGYTEGFMMLVGAVEIIVGIGVIFKPQVFGYIIGVWLAFIILNLLYMGDFYDIALRDLGLCLSAFAFSRLAKACA